MTTGRLRAQPHAELRHGLLGLEAKETATGWRVDHRASQFDDHVVAVGLVVSGLPAVRGDMPVLVGGPRVAAQEYLARMAGQNVIVYWEEKSIQRSAEAARSPVATKRDGPII